MNKKQIQKISASLKEKFGGIWNYLEDGENEIFQLQLYGKYLPGLLGRFLAESVIIEYDHYNESYSLYVNNVHDFENQHSKTENEDEVLKFIQTMPSSHLPWTPIH